MIHSDILSHFSSMAYSNMHSMLSGVVLFILIITFTSPASAQLSPSFYASTCPTLLDMVRSTTRSAVNRDLRMGASLLRLFFHDCFVNGCDGGILLADIPGSFIGERGTISNGPSMRGFDVIDNIKDLVDRTCGPGIVSCSDILALSARDSIVELGGRSYTVPLGRRDARTANYSGARDELPSPVADSLQILIEKFDVKDFNAREMVALSGAHSLGTSRCVAFRARIYGGIDIDPAFATLRQATCPRTVGVEDGNLAPMDPQSPNRFGNNYFQALLIRRGLLSSDQVLYSAGGQTAAVVSLYANDPTAFATDFTNAMIKMGNLRPSAGTQDEIRNSCQSIN